VKEVGAQRCTLDKVQVGSHVSQACILALAGVEWIESVRKTIVSERLVQPFLNASGFNTKCPVLHINTGVVDQLGRYEAAARGSRVGYRIELDNHSVGSVGIPRPNRLAVDCDVFLVHPQPNQIMSRVGSREGLVVIGKGN
jgi:hypothetical protein